MPENIILMSRREDPFARVPKSLLNDSRLSWKAKGIISYLIGKPSDWKTNVLDVSLHSTDGVKAVRSAMNELKKLGYARLDKVQSANGKIAEWLWKISDSPIFSPDAPNGHVAKGHTQNGHHTKIECTKNEFTKSKEPEGTSPSADAIFPSEWKPSQRSKEDQLKRIRPPQDYPSQDEFDAFLQEGRLENIANYRPDLYAELCRNKWHQWKVKHNKWIPIRDWRDYVAGLESKILAVYH